MLDSLLFALIRVNTYISWINRESILALTLNLMIQAIIEITAQTWAQSDI